MLNYYHLIVVGKGVSRPYLKLALSLGIKERVHFLGPQPAGWRYATLCKVLILFSQYDPFGGAAAEGHAMGAPVLVSDKTGYSDMVLHGQKWRDNEDLPYISNILMTLLHNCYP